MLTKRSATRNKSHQSSVTKPKSKRKMLTIAEKINLLDMLQQGKTYAAVGRSYGINESSVRYIKKDERNIRATAAISVSKTTKRVVTPRNRNIIKMEAKLVSWILASKENNAPLTPSIICRQARTIYHNTASINGSKQSTDSRPTKFNASNGWYEKFQKRHGLRNLYSVPAATLELKNGKECLLANSSTDEEDFELKEVSITADVNERQKGTVRKRNKPNENEGDITLSHLTTIVTLTREIQRMAQDWDPKTTRSSRFASGVQDALSVYETLLAEKSKENQSVASCENDRLTGCKNCAIATKK